MRRLNMILKVIWYSNTQVNSMSLLVKVIAIRLKTTCIVNASSHAGIGEVCDVDFAGWDTHVWRGWLGGVGAVSGLWSNLAVLWMYRQCDEREVCMYNIFSTNHYARIFTT